MRLLLALLVAAPGLAFAAGDDDATPPKPTDTTKTCLFGRVWDAEKQKCVKPEKSSMDTDGLYDAARELAYAGRYDEAQGVLRVMPDQNDDRVLTYWGFTHRKLGNLTLANAFYEQAITTNPDNILARSYMGQGYVEEGRTDLAVAQWREIVARGGTGTWAEESLRRAIKSGMTFSY